MFGYFKLDKACPTELSKAYKKYYCLLCRVLGRHYGAPARFLLSFDVTFFLIFLAPEELAKDIQKVGCLKTDLPLRDTWDHPLLKQVAALNILLAAGKLEDDRLDDGDIKAWLAEKVFAGAIKAAKKDYPHMWQIIIGEYRKIRDMENEDQSLESIEEAFSIMMVRLVVECFGVQDEPRVRLLREATKWLYFADAVDDLDENLKKNTFNPLKGYQSFGKLKNEHYSFVGDHFAHYFRTHDRLSGGINSAIINRVMYYGMPEEMVRILTRKRSDK